MATSNWPTDEHPGVAIIAPTGYDTFGVWWSDFPAMERRGGYSGPYRTRELATDGARDWATYWECPVSIIHQDTTPVRTG